MKESVQFSQFSDIKSDLKFDTLDTVKEDKLLHVASKVASRNGGLIYVPVVNSGTFSGYLSSAALVCNLRGVEDDFWIFACPLWQFRGNPRLESGLNLLELAVQGYSLYGKESAEANRHVAYIYEMARLRTLSFVRSGKANDEYKRKAKHILSFVEAIASIAVTDDGLDYQIFDTVKEDVDCRLEIITIEFNGKRYEDKIIMHPLAMAFWLSNYQCSAISREIIQFKQELNKIIAP